MDSYFCDRTLAFVLLADSLHDVVTANADRFILCTGVRPVRTDGAIHIITGGAVIHTRRPVGPGVLASVAYLSNMRAAEHAPWFFVLLQPVWSSHVFIRGRHGRQSVRNARIWPPATGSASMNAASYRNGGSQNRRNLLESPGR